jgi:hypothetical protein
MDILRLTKKHFKETDSYYKEYIGKEDVSNYDGAIEIEGGLGYVRFSGSLRATKYILAKAGSGIEAGEGIEAGSGIKAGEGIEAGEGIKAGWGIKAGSGIEAGWGIKAGSGIEAGWGIKAGSGIEAGWGIKAGSGIEAGWGIKAGWGIVSGLAITCRLTLSFTKNLFAGVAWWKKTSEEEQTITCGKLQGGEIKFGILKETGLLEEECEHSDCSCNYCPNCGYKIK